MNTIEKMFMGISPQMKKSNNRKPTKGRQYRKQYAPLYSKKEIEEMVDAGKPSYYIEQCKRRKKLILHETA